MADFFSLQNNFKFTPKRYSSSASSSASADVTTYARAVIENACTPPSGFPPLTVPFTTASKTCQGWSDYGGPRSAAPNG